MLTHEVLLALDFQINFNPVLEGDVPFKGEPPSRNGPNEFYSELQSLGESPYQAVVRP